MSGGSQREVGTAPVLKKFAGLARKYLDKPFSLRDDF